MQVKLIETLSDGVILETEYGRQIWSAVIIRKVHNCAVCGKFKLYGSVLFRPTPPKQKQVQYICLDCLTELKLSYALAGNLEQMHCPKCNESIVVARNAIRRNCPHCGLIFNVEK